MPNISAILCCYPSFFGRKKHERPESIKPQRPNLLAIPRELRDQILTYVLVARRQPPTTLSEIRQQDRDFRDGRLEKNIYYSRNPADYKSNSLPALLTCRQLHSEILEILNRFSFGYELDVKFLNERYFVPTWVLIPIISKNIPHLRAVFQSMGTYERQPEEFPIGNEYGQMDIWRQGCGGPPLYVWMFYDLLERFLNFGPVGPVDPDKSEVVTINCLELDFVDPEDTSLLPPEPLTEHERSRSLHLHVYGSWSRDEPMKMLRPESLARNLAGQINGLLNMGYHSASYGTMLYERIGRIVVKVNGDVLGEFDIGQMLADLKFNDDFGNYAWNHRVSQWVYFKQSAMKMRRDRGLRVVEPSENCWEEAQATADRLYAGRKVWDPIANTYMDD
ncbi:hypothetical protein K458DRAFT_486370 [Lentithecium fluviatile CBS 122367]|uniref:F-box domain-containing protein n=1 Tax=Lentithecium fluviatile CBS 122367 TaxID=1168545 RepID=A0A6G1J8F5_9PLEO|nr:hypothetical protein K458DRAFT_486370 [Lentithecium fluviatile CBS 122367]